MSPSFPTAGRVCFVSLPAFAIILSLVWYRKKRGSRKSDSGGAVEETRDDKTSVNCEEEEEEEEVEKESVDNNKSISDELIESRNQNRIEVIEIVDQVIVKNTDTESSPRQETAEITEVCEKEIGVIETQLKAVEEEEPQQNQKQQEEEEQQQQQQSANKSKCGKKANKSKCGKKAKKMAKKLANEKKEDNTACILEKKLAELDLSGKKCNGVVDEEKSRPEDVAERDSANNSPSEVMLASPSVSGYSDTHSEVRDDRHCSRQRRHCLSPFGVICELSPLSAAKCKIQFRNVLREVPGCLVLGGRRPPDPRPGDGIPFRKSGKCLGVSPEAAQGPR